MVMDSDRGEQYLKWRKQLWSSHDQTGPELIIVVSAHWESRELILGTAESQDLIYDFYGFPEELYKIQYPGPGAPEDRSSLQQYLQKQGLTVHQEERGWDHGVWTPMYWLFPEANVPILQLSLPSYTPAELFALGQHIANWMGSRKGVWLIGSGGLTHNLGAIDFSGGMEVPAPMQQFQDFIKKALEDGDDEALLNYRRTAPHAQINHPSQEHFLPLIVVVGAARTAAHNRIQYPLDGFELGSLSRTTVDFLAN